MTHTHTLFCVYCKWRAKDCTSPSKLVPLRNPDWSGICHLRCQYMRYNSVMSYYSSLETWIVYVCHSEGEWVRQHFISAFEWGMVVGARSTGLSMSRTEKLLGFSRSRVSRVYQEWSTTQRTSSHITCYDTGCQVKCYRLDNTFNIKCSLIILDLIKKTKITFL